MTSENESELRVCTHALCGQAALSSPAAKQSLLGPVLGGIPGALLNGLNVSRPLNQRLEVSSEGL